MEHTHLLAVRQHSRNDQPWWLLLLTYLCYPDTMLDNPLLSRIVRERSRPPMWRPQIGTLWIFPLAAIGAVLLSASSLGEGGGTSAAVGIGFAAAICVYPPYLLGGAIAFLLPARIAPALSAEVEARTLDILRLTNLTPGEIVLGKLFGVLIPFEGLLNYVVTFFILILLLSLLGSGVVPVALGLPVTETVSAMILVGLPLVFGPLVSIAFACALSIVVSAYTTRPDVSIAASYGLGAAYWILTGMLQMAIMAALSQVLPVNSILGNVNVASPISLLFFPNPTRLVASTILTPVLLHFAVQRVGRM